MRLAALLTLLLIGGCLEARAQDHASLPGIGVGGVGGSDGIEDMTAGGDVPTFDLNFADGSSVPSSALTVNGVTMTPVLDCDARDISGTNWPCDVGGTLAEAGAGSSPTSGLPVPLTEGAARGVLGASGKYHQAGSTSTADITTSDMAVEVLFKAVATADTPYIIGKLGTDGWTLDMSGTSLRLTLNDSDTSASTTIGTLTAGAWYHALVFVDRSENSTNGSVGYLNTTAGTGVNQSGQAGSLTNTTAVSVGGASGAVSDDVLAFARVWTCTACMAGGATNPTQWAAIAKERFAQLVGTDADVAGGQSYPSTFTRASIATLDADRDDDGVRRAFVVGAGWPRVVKRDDDDGTLRTGYLSEPQATNLVLQSATFGTTWSKHDAGDTITNGTSAPDGSTDGDAIIADATNGQHGVAQLVGLTATTYTFSVWAKAGTQGHLHISDETVANADSYFDLSPCAVGTNGAGASNERAETWGGGWCRVSITYTGTGGAPHNHRIFCAEADNDNAFSGDGAATACTLWGAQIELQPTATSYIATTTASATRVDDVLHYSPTSNASSLVGTLETSYFCADGLSASSFRAGGLSDGSANQITFTDVGGGNWGALYYRASGYEAAVGPAASSALVDGTHTVLRMAWNTNDVRYWFDGALSGTPDTVVTTFADGTATRLALLNNGATVSSPSGPCVGTRVRVWGSVEAP